MTNGLITLTGTSGQTTTITVTRPGGHSQTDTITISAPITTPGAPTASNATSQTSNSLTFPVTLNASGDLPTALAWRYSTDNATWTNGSDITLTSPSLGQNLSETVSVPGASTLYYVQFAEKNTAGTSSFCASVTGTTSAGGSYAWNSTTPRATALVSDRPGADYTGTADFLSNSKGRYDNSSISSACSIDSGLQVGGVNTLAVDRTVANAQLLLTVPNFASQTDIVYHTRRALMAAQTNDVLPSVNYTNYPTNANSTHAVITGLAFDKATYDLPVNISGSSGSGILLVIDSSGTQYPVYSLVMDIRSTTGTLLSSRSVTGTTPLGDEAFNSTLADYFIRAWLDVAAKTLHAQACLGKPSDIAPKVLASGSITMNDGSMPPMPKYGVFCWQEPWFVTPAVTRLDFHQILDNAAHPNEALDFTTVADANGVGLGERGSSIVDHTFPIDKYADDTAFQADIISGTSPIHGRWTSYFGTSAPYLITATDAAHGNQPFFRMHHPASTDPADARHASGLHDDRPHLKVYDVWMGETILFSPGWSNFGAGLRIGTFNAAITASASPQTVAFTPYTGTNNNSARTGSGTAGYGTAAFEYINITAVDTVNNTITAIFSQNHAAGDEFASAQGPGYKIQQIAGPFATGTADFRMELVGTAIESYMAGGSGWDPTYPVLTKSGLGGLATGADTNSFFASTGNIAGSATDFITTPAVNSMNESSRPGTRAAQGQALWLRTRAKVWYDADYARNRVRLEHYLGYANQTPAFYQLVEGFMAAGQSGYFNGFHAGENINERFVAAQDFDRWQVRVRDPNVASVGADPYGVVAAMGLAVPGAATTMTPTSAASTSITYNVTAPASGATVLGYVVEVFNGTVWVPKNTTADGWASVTSTWTAGAGGTQAVTVAGLTASTDYSNKIGIRLVSNFGMGPRCVATSGATTA